MDCVSPTYFSIRKAILVRVPIGSSQSDGGQILSLWMNFKSESLKETIESVNDVRRPDKSTQIYADSSINRSKESNKIAKQMDI